jgi:hypothetical protein
VLLEGGHSPPYAAEWAEGVKPMSQEESLRIQLSELNQRSRMYATQMWQVPFAYLGVVGIMLALTNKSLTHLTTQMVAFVLFLIGIIVLWFMLGIFKAIGKSVGHIKRTEHTLGIKQTVEEHHWCIDIPIFSLVIITIVVCALVAFGKI